MANIKYVDNNGLKYSLQEFLKKLDLRFAEIDHTHTAADITDFATEVNKLMTVGGSHTHANLTVLDGITEAKVTEWNEKLGKTDVIDNLTSTDVDKPLSANQGKILNDNIGDKTTLTTTAKNNLVGAVNELDGEIGILTNLKTTEKSTMVGAVNELFDDKVNKSDIVDNLTSTDVDKPLSANQGKVLKDSLDTLKTTVGDVSSGLVKDVADLKALNAEENVQADWNEVDTSSDAYIKNKPEVITTAEIDTMIGEIFV